MDLIEFAAVAHAAAPAPAWTPGDAEAWLHLLGRLHVVAVHFPIALVIVGALIEVFRLPRRKEEAPRKWRPSGGALACVVIGALMGGVVAWAGWVYAAEIGAGKEVDLHRWLGIGAAGAAGLAAVVGLVAWAAPDRARLAGYRFLALVAAVAVGFAGHFGGGLVHGDGHLTGPLRVALGLAAAEPTTEQAAAPDAGAAARSEPPVPPTPPPASAPAGAPVEAAADPAVEAPVDPAPAVPDPASAPESITFAHVAPILESACFRCHGRERQRGRLRLDTEDGLFSVIARGDAGASELHRRISLPADDRARMPKGDADPLTPEQIALIGAWIEALPPAPEPPSSPIEPPAPDETVPAQPEPPAPMPTLTADERTARDVALAALRGRGMVAQVVAEGVDACEVRIVGAATFGDEDVALLTPLAPSLIWLDLTGSDITDTGAAALVELRRLRRLRLGETTITDAAVAGLAALDELEMLDLHATGVTDGALEDLAALTRLRSLYLWKTRVTPAGAATLTARSPWLEIDLGNN